MAATLAQRGQHFVTRYVYWLHRLRFLVLVAWAVLAVFGGLYGFALFSNISDRSSLPESANSIQV